MDFLALALAGMAGWDQERTTRILATRATSVTTLRNQPQVRLHYSTVTVDGGEMRVRQDIYGLDAAYARAMESRSRSPGVTMAAAQI